MAQSFVQIGLRVTPEMHKELKKLATKKNESPLNTYIVSVLEQHLAKEQDARTHTKAKG